MLKKKSNKKLRLAIIGGGLRSTIGKAHFIAIKESSKFEICFGCFSREKKINYRSGKAYELKNNQIYNNWKIMIKENFSKIDAVLILLPTPQHFSVLNFIIKCNLPVICEKPLVTSRYQAQKLIDQTKKSKIFIGTTYNYPGFPLLREMFYQIKSNKIGKINNFIFEMHQDSLVRLRKKIKKWRLIDKFIPTIISDLGSHLFFLTKLFFEKKPLKLLSSFHKSKKIKNIVAEAKILLKYKNDLNGLLLISKNSIGQRNDLKLRVYGEKGSLIWSIKKPEILEVYKNNGNMYLLDRGSKNLIGNYKNYSNYSPGHPLGFVEAFSNLYKDLGTCLNNYLNNKPFKNQFLFDHHDALDVANFFEATSISNKKNKWITLKK